MWKYEWCTRARNSLDTEDQGGRERRSKKRERENLSLPEEGVELCGQGRMAKLEILFHFHFKLPVASI